MIRRSPSGRRLIRRRWKTAVCRSCPAPTHTLINPSNSSGFMTPEQAVELTRDAEIIQLELEAGECVLLHNHLPHSSEVNNTDIPRKAFSACYMDAATKAAEWAAVLHNFRRRRLAAGASLSKPGRDSRCGPHLHEEGRDEEEGGSSLSLFGWPPIRGQAIPTIAHRGESRIIMGASRSIVRQVRISQSTWSMPSVVKQISRMSLNVNPV